MTQHLALTDTIRHDLQQRAESLRLEIAAAEHPLDGADADVRDRKDLASDRILGALADAETRRDLDELMMVEAALRRLELGTYGLCLECGETIPAPRLAAQPAALRCAACQYRLERQQHGFHGH